MAYNPSNTNFYGLWKFLYGDNDPRVATGLDWNANAIDGFFAVLNGLLSVPAYNPAASYTPFTTGCTLGGNRYLCVVAPPIAGSTVASISLASGIYTVNVASGANCINGMAITATDGTNSISGVIASGGGTNALVLASGAVVAGTPASMTAGSPVNASWAPPNSAYWLLVGPTPTTASGLIWSGPWNSSTPYTVGEVVLQGGVAYLCIAANTNSAPPSANWQVLSVSVGASGLNWRGPWSASANYAVGDTVSDGGSAWIAVAPNTNSEPPNTSWNVLVSQGAAGATGATGAASTVPGPAGLNWRGPWSSGASYAVNDAVSYIGSAWICVTANTNSAPPSAAWNVLASGGTSGVPAVPYPLPVIDKILGDTDPGTNIHLELQVSTDPTFVATPTLDIQSKNVQTAWYYDNGSGWTAWPSGGVVADYTWGQDQFGQHVDSPTNATGYNWMYAIPSGLVAGTVYYIRWRQWDVQGAEYGRWHYGSLKV